MGEIGILSWYNEAAMTPYPLQQGFGFDGFLLDATFQQFDNFIPVLTSLTRTDDYIEVNLKMDSGPLSLTVSIGEITGAIITKSLIDASNRYMGRLTFGYDILGPFEGQAEQTITLNIPFLPHVVKSIPSTAGVYSIDGAYYDVTVSADANISFDFIDISNEIVFNAVAVPTAISEPYLKTLNGVGPLHNNVYIKDTEILKVTSPSTATIQFSIIGANLSDVLSKISNIIVTNPLPIE